METDYAMDWKTQHRKYINPPPNDVCRFTSILLNLPARFLLVDIDKFILKFVWKGVRPGIAKII